MKRAVKNTILPLGFVFLLALTRMAGASNVFIANTADCMVTGTIYQGIYDDEVPYTVKEDDKTSVKVKGNPGKVIAMTGHCEGTEIFFRPYIFDWYHYGSYHHHFIITGSSHLPREIIPVDKKLFTSCF